MSELNVDTEDLVMLRGQSARVIHRSTSVGTASSVHHPPCYDKKNPFLQNGAHDPSLGDYLASSYGVEGRCQRVTHGGGVIISDEEAGAGSDDGQA